MNSNLVLNKHLGEGLLLPGETLFEAPPGGRPLKSSNAPGAPTQAMGKLDRQGSPAAGGREALPSWRATRRKLSFCWCDPDASEEISAAYRIRQFQALSEQTPLSAFDNATFSLLLAWLFWQQADPYLLAAWCGAIWSISAFNLSLWHRHQEIKESRDCKRDARLLTANITILAFLFSVIPTYLFGAADLKGKIILVAVTTGFVAHGALQFARWPLAGILWNVGMCIGTFTTVLYLYGDTYSYIAWLTLAYFAIMCVSVLLASKLFVKSLMAETKIDQQKQLIDLLLHDFEDDASDWLWETDPHGNLRRASSRLAETIGVTPSSLLGQPITSVLFKPADNLANDPAGGAHRLAACLHHATPFRNVEGCFRHADGERWWSLSGKPLRDMHGRLVGWRGVGSDITAERNLQASREMAARTAGELDTARRIQRGLLPDLAAIAASESRFSVAAILEPALQVGGDYYECFALDEKRYCFAVADVSGKGVPASLFMAMTKMLSASRGQCNKDLGDAISDIANELDRNNPEMLFVTTFVVVLDTESGELTCVSAGHEAPLLLRNGQVLHLDLGEQTGPPMCAIPGYRFQAVRKQLLEGDLLCLFTDGATEATDGSAFFGTPRLMETLVAQPEHVSPQACTEALRQRIRQFEAGTPPADDLTIMTLRWHGAQT